MMHDNRTDHELEKAPDDRVTYTLPLVVRHRTFGSQFRYWFRTERDREVFARVMEPLGWEEV